jgi:hypothetical protein
MFYFNKIYSSSTERIIARSPSTGTFDIELQHPQPRRRQTFDYNHENDNEKDQYGARAYSMPPIPGEFQSFDPEQSARKNSVVTIPTNLPSITAPDPPLIVSPTPEIIEET